ncbi:FadR/GntR family transcriptional regulator [Pacificibacter marinus]|uniref:HTH-type transcriptional regulator LutR n=1 Tax=Pacificibacter marinus TaxID=658057 RepID=A0A1Y5SDA1_9RHOB|nr:FadR/GntR family transcriptional regulator [Pacificibacter marinus]SEK51621.1 DNA-binding transcriptional regulator, FadR family [Pacificibacter marinus]SLN38077.1 HTH-type transcriptional regulator LutR [Pacificibacter marinus]
MIREIKTLESAAQNTPTVQRDRLHATVSAALEARILSGDLKIGDKLESESAIAKGFGVSTRAVREAIQTLETKGLVMRRHGGRTTVVREDVSEFLDTLAITVRQRLSSDPTYLEELMAARRMIETEVIELLCQGTESIAAPVTQALEQMKEARDAGDFASFVDADAAFHLALVHSAQNGIISIIYDNFAGLINEVIQLTSRVPTKSLEAAYEEHAEIYGRICRKDEAQAKALMRSQIDNSADYLRIAIEKNLGEET